ncbi:peptidoglycan-binding domain-containing protein [Xanthomonas campestris]|uniref:peptidoglycan-binding domain-containing protein n=1 Tax=Xanthomonas campestris TaxID=339 RepID=UPI00096DE3D5|nr:peptidoglycan-binding domain-containing protein [Xanthomonas campestris]MCF8826058.1 peptidoglycan-binding protein [Xanthomonas campestris pv. raphani]MEA9838765.1 peptidoglycan-binding domain-containing protein [Xanthomonas campestris pv. raphani]MEA9878506.1 peptidoglycan-binding domain-containing protein [Xanthomonas campestris pv. raphani]MEA9892745.1 peptidoglycan-binding domain-containing protein [Xanthomonas campestris pv. raphani]MEA9933678.1 peptidoglycan-binding domain-containing 
MTESNGGDLSITNKQGYVGRYQSGAGWLADAGYVDSAKLNSAMRDAGFDPDKVRGAEWKWATSGGMTRFLEDSSNWKDGLNLQKYKGSAELQDGAFKINSDKSYRQAVRDGVLDSDDSPTKVAGFLKARHISGYGGARAAITGGREFSDSNGTSNYDYMHDITRNRDGMDQYMQPGRSHAMHTNTSAVPQQPKRDASHDGKLEQGERGEQVKQLQGQLAQLGAIGRDGKPLQADGDFGGNTKYAVEQFQREHGLQIDGVAGQQTQAALAKALTQAAPKQPDHTAAPAAPAQAASSPLLSDPRHPDNAMYNGAVSKLEALGERGGFANRKELEQAAGQIVFESKVSGLQRIDHVVPNKSGDGFFAVQGEMTDPAMQRVFVDRSQAQNQPLENSSRQAAEESQRQATQVQTQETASRSMSM